MKQSTTTYDDRSGPVRTCVGCRQRDAQSRLLRVAVSGGRLAADPRRRLPGRGAYVHHDPDCAARAVRKGGIARALRAPVGPADLESVRQAVAASHAADRPVQQRSVRENVLKGQR